VLRRHHLDDRQGIRRLQQAQQFVAQALAGEALQVRRLLSQHGQGRRLGRQLAVVGLEAEEPQQAQIVLADSLARFPDEAHTAGRQVLAPAEGVEKLPFRAAGHGVEGEVPARRIGLPVVGEGDPGATAVGLHVLAQGGDLERPVPGDGGDRAVVESRGHGLQPGGAQQVHYLLGPVGSRQVHVLHRAAGQRVAHAAADETYLRAFRPQGRDHGPRFRGRHPGLRLEPLCRRCCRHRILRTCRAPA